MKLPKKIKVLSRDYTVRPMDAHEEGDNQVFGRCDRDSALITVDSRCSSQKQAHPLLHETIHAIIFEMGIYKHFHAGDRTITEEDVATIMGSGLSAVMRDNPALMPAIQKGLK